MSVSLERLSPEQRAVVLSRGRGLAVMAGAGSGKTTTLVAKCLHLTEGQPEARFAAVSFTERSASDLRVKLSQGLPHPPNGGPALAGHWVMTIHGLCGSILREYPREAGFDGEERMLSESEARLLWERAIEALWFEELTEEVSAALSRLLARESLAGLKALLARARELCSFGALGFLERAEDADSQALGRLTRFLLERYTRLKRRRGALDFNDLEAGADRALENASVREAFHRKFELVLVDEFQDTNPLQARVIERFCRPGYSNLCIVGDPKQSIYRFRDADVSVFEDFCRKLPEKHSLTWNFRSRPAIIEYANALCAPAFAVSEMPYEALVPKREATAADAVVRLDLKDPAELAAWIQAEVRRGVALEDMALLLRRIRGNEKWLKALTSAGIPIAVGSGGLFWEDARVRELVALLKWWDNPGNSLSAAVFLRAPWVGVTDREIDAWVKQDPTFVEPFFHSTNALAQALAPLRDKLVRPAEVLLALAQDGTAEAELGASLLGLWHRVEELSLKGLGFSAVVAELTHSIEEGRRERDVPPPRNHGQLSVLTLHSSKGLEFPHVILIDLGKKPRASDSPLLFWDQKDGAYFAGRDSDGERTPDELNEARWREREKGKSLAESKRLFYVALTRARERLVLVCPELPPPAASAKAPETPYSVDDWRGWVEACPGEILRVTAPAPEARTAREAGPLPAAPARPRVEKSRLRRARHSVTEWNLLARCGRAYEWSFIRPRVVPAGIAEIGLFTGEKKVSVSETELTHQELGSRVHAALEKGDYEALRGLEREAGATRFLAEPVISWAMSSDWMAPSAPARGREVWAELDFEVPLGDAVLVGSMDRVVRSPEAPARYTIIDFKVTEKPKSVGTLLESYQTQLELYAFALSRLDPEAGAIGAEALLVNISPRQIQAVPVEVGTGAVDVEALASDSLRIVGGEPGRPIPGRLCRYCEFRPICAEGQAIELPGD